jgi:hypothetical protein
MNYFFDKKPDNLAAFWRIISTALGYVAAANAVFM